MILGLLQTQEHGSQLPVNLSTGPKSLMTLVMLVLTKKMPHWLSRGLCQPLIN